MRRHRRVGFVLMITSVLFLAVGVLTYELVLPGLFARQYEQRVTQNLPRLRNVFKDIEKSAEADFLSDPTIPLAKKQAEAKKIQSTIARGHDAILQFREDAAKLQSLPYAGYTDNYKKAVVTKSETEDVIRQADSALVRYAELVSFLISFAEVQDRLEAQLNSFNTTVDVNIYSGQGATMREYAARIRNDAAGLEKQPIPNDLLELRARMRDIDNRAADAFDMLARGLDTAIDTTIYDAAANIEATSRQIDVELPQYYTSSVQNSRAVKDVVGLVEKLDLLE